MGRVSPMRKLSPVVAPPGWCGGCSAGWRERAFAVRKRRCGAIATSGRPYSKRPPRVAQSAAELKKALDLAPDSFRERLNYGLALLRSGSVKEGIAELEKAQKQDPTDTAHLV